MEHKFNICHLLGGEEENWTITILEKEKKDMIFRKADAILKDWNQTYNVKVKNL